VRTSGPWDALYVFCRISAFAVAHMSLQICQIVGGGILFEHFGGSNILDAMAALCGGAPADWMIYFVSVSDKPKGVVISYS
jgi:hypothetical protein